MGLPGDYRVACVLSVPVQTEVGVINHKGLLGDRLGPDDLPTVIHAAKLFEQIIESTMSEYLLMAVGPLSSEGYPGLLPPHEVLARARSQITKPWRLWHNCEHFVAWAHAVPVRSPQLRTAVKKVGMTAGLVAALVGVARFAR